MRHFSPEAVASQTPLGIHKPSPCRSKWAAAKGGVTASVVVVVVVVVVSVSVATLASCSMRRAPQTPMSTDSGFEPVRIGTWNDEATHSSSTHSA
jgi:hypothetical protein